MSFVKHSNIRNANWEVWQDSDGFYPKESVHRAILLDIRQELAALKKLLECPNFLDIPHKLDAIAKNTRHPAKKRGKHAPR